ncbi:MAG: hypothetical protein WC512_03165, partial [Candidatus Omnitrophota bacterium]
MLKKIFSQAVYHVLLALILSSVPAFAAAQPEAEEKTQPPTFEIKQIDEVFVPFQNGIPYPSWERQEREYIDLDGQWRSQRQAV